MGHLVSTVWVKHKRKPIKRTITENQIKRNIRENQIKRNRKPKKSNIRENQIKIPSFFLQRNNFDYKLQRHRAGLSACLISVRSQVQALLGVLYIFFIFFILYGY